MARVCILSSVHSALDNRVFYREAHSLRRGGHEVLLVAVHNRDEVRDGVQIVGLPRVPRWRRPLLWFTLLRHALRSGAELFHFHDPELLLVMPLLRLLTRKPTIYDVHEAYADFILVKDYLPAWLRLPIAWAFRRLEPLLSRMQSALIYADDQIAASFARVRLPQETLFNFPERSFIETAAATVQARSEREGQRAPVILYLGGMERNRGSRLMVDAFQQVRQALPEAHLVLVGHFMPPDLEEEVRSDAAQREVADAITFTGRLPFEEIGTHLSQAAVGWVPWQPVVKNKKNIPTKLFEYMAYALPVVSSDLPSTRPYVKQGMNGFLVEADCAAAHAEAILRLLRRPVEAQAMGQRGQEMVRTRWNWDAMEERLLTLYQSLLS